MPFGMSGCAQQPLIYVCVLNVWKTIHWRLCEMAAQIIFRRSNVFESCGASFDEIFDKTRTDKGDSR